MAPPVRGVKVCTTCREEKPISEFYKDARSADGFYSRCKRCHRCSVAKYQHEDPQRRRAQQLMVSFRLTKTEAERCVAITACDLCGGDDLELQIDQCQRTGNIRGVLCFRCNTALYSLGDDPERLRAGAIYLEERAAAPFIPARSDHSIQS